MNILGFLQAAFWFVVVLGVLVSLHELGHFWVARRLGVKVLTYSVGFGRALWSRTGADGTRYQVAAIPLGGYVQFLDDREAEVAPAERHRAFGQQPPWKRILIVLAGPVANLVLCVALLWLAFLIGWPGHAPVIGPTAGIAADSGLRAGDRILAVGDAATPAWDDTLTPLVLAEMDRRPVTLRLLGADGREREQTLRLDRLPADWDQTDPLGAIGLQAQVAMDLPLVGRVQPGSPAEGRLQPGDRILAINGQDVAGFSAIAPALEAAMAATPGAEVRVAYARGDARGEVRIAPRRQTVEGQVRWLLGVAADRPIAMQRYAPVQAAAKAVQETWKQTGEMLGFIGRLVTGQASSKNISGVIGIAQVARAEADQGVSRLLRFMALLSLTLCIMNLLPIPVLDGGHLLYYLIELVSGRPVGERVLVAGQYAGLLLLAGLICLAFYNDIVRTIS